jgi:hypothetical protein
LRLDTMSPGEYLRSLRAPDESRWQPMLVGLALFAAGAGGAVLAQNSALASAVLTLLALAAWVVGACAMIGYVRWYFSSEVQQAKRDQQEERRGRE